MYSRELNIAMLGHKRIPSREGGVEVVVEELAKRMVNHGNNVTVYNRKGAHVANGENAKMLDEHCGVNMKWVPTINKKGLDALLYSIIASVRVAVGKYDIIHYHAEGSCAMLWIPKLFGKNVIATIHGLDWKRAKWGGFASKYILIGEKIAVKYADEIIVLSEGVQDYFMETYERETYLVPNGVNEPQYHPAKSITKKYDLEKDSYILFLARIVPEKGLHYLIDAYRALNTDKKLVIAGGASHTTDYLKEINEKVQGNDNIIMTGFVQGRMLEELFSNAYMYVLPSDIEGMPLSLLEAMSYGKVCVVSDIPENLDVIGEDGYSFKRGDVKHLQEILNDALTTSPDDMGKRAKDKVLRKYNWDDVTCDTLSRYQKIGR